ncbi:hypothetical protein TNCV_1424451, partial [Trichonephila clavipes]
QINIESDSDSVQELPNFYNQELTTNELIEMYEHEQDIEEESLDPVQSPIYNERIRSGRGRHVSMVVNS